MNIEQRGNARDHAAKDQVGQDRENDRDDYDFKGIDKALLHNLIDRIQDRGEDEDFANAFHRSRSISLRCS